MWANRKIRRFIAWIASLSILLVAFAPSMSHAVASAGGGDASWMEICSSAGTRSRLVQVDDEHKPASSLPVQKAMQFEHCFFCFTHAGSFGLPPSTQIALSVLKGKPVLPSLYYQSPQPLFVWAAAHSRAPPVRS